MYKAVVLFVAFAVALMLGGAALAATQQVEAESMRMPADGYSILSSTAASGGKYVNLHKNRTISHGFSGAVDKLTVRAKGRYYYGAWPRMVVRVDGTTVLSRTANSSTFQNFTVDLPTNIADGTHTLSVSFTNDYYYRNLHVDAVTIDSGSTSSPPPPDSGGILPPPPDTDGDGVIDDVDQCDNEPGPATNNGCPVTQPPGPGLCADAIDNDGDKKIDLGDPGCADAADNDESNSASPPIPAADSGGFVTGNTAANASTNRQAFLSLSNTCRNVTLPPGDYFVANGGATPFVEVQNYCGTFAFQEGARLHYLDPFAGGVRFRYGTGARFINWESFHPATVRGNPQDNFSLYNTTDSTIDSMTIHGGNVGIMLWLTTRPTIINSHAEFTLADGMHIVASSNAQVRDWSAYWTGDDGLSFQTYTEQYPVSSGTANGVTSIESATRGITVLGSQNVTVSNFVVRNSWTSGLYVACEPTYNDCAAKPVRNVRYEHGKVFDAGRAHNGTGPNPDSITVWRSPNDDITFSDIESHTPVRDCYRGFEGGFATLINVRGDGVGC